MSIEERTFRNLLVDLTGVLDKYKCWCNAEDNLQLVKETIEGFFKAKGDLGIIQHWKVACGPDLNPSRIPGYLQRINATFSVGVGEYNYMGMVVIGTARACCFMLIDLDDAYDSACGDKAIEPEDPLKAYERAMKGL